MTPLRGPHKSTQCLTLLLIIYRLGWRTDGAAYAVVCCQATVALLIGGYRMYRDLVVLKGSPKQTWHGWSTTAFRGWGKYLEYGLPAAIVSDQTLLFCLSVTLARLNMLMHCPVHLVLYSNEHGA